MHALFALRNLQTTSSMQEVNLSTRKLHLHTATVQSVPLRSTAADESS
jgi:hypothetical protein